MNLSLSLRLVLGAFRLVCTFVTLALLPLQAHADDKFAWEIESDLHEDFAREDVTVTIDGRRHSRLQTRQAHEATNVRVPYRPGPGPHFYELSGTSQPAARGRKARRITGKGWLYAQQELAADFARLAPLPVLQRIQRIHEQWRPRLKKTGGGALVTSERHGAASAASIAAAEARLGMKLPEAYVQAVSQPYMAYQPETADRSARPGLFPPEAIVSVYEFLGKPKGDTLKGERAFKRMRRHFLLAGDETGFLIARDDVPDAASRAASPLLQEVGLNDETATEDSDAYDFYPFHHPGKRPSTVGAFVEAAALSELKRSLARAGVTLLGEGRLVRLWRLEMDDEALLMELRYISYDEVETD